MLKGHSLIYFAPEKWDGLWRNRQQLMSVFAQHNKVLFVEPRPHLRSTLSRWRGGDIESADLGHSPVRKVSKGLYVFRYPFWTSVSGRFPMNRITQRLRRQLLTKSLDQLQMSEPIIWFSRTGMINLFDEIPPARLKVYHVVDGYASYPNKTLKERQLIERQEKEMLSQVDLVIVVSEALYRAKRALNANTYLVPNGVNHQAYTTALSNPSLPGDLDNISPPRLGYSGLISDKLNLTLLKHLAQRHPEWSLVFLGEAKVKTQLESWETLLKLPNVHYLGLIAISEVPNYLKGFTVGLMPYQQNEHSENISPLKLYDYLAAGLPVASIDFPAARQFKSHIHLAKTPQDFEQVIQAALADNGVEQSQAQRELAAQHTWEARVEQISDLFEARLQAKTYQNA